MCLYPTTQWFGPDQTNVQSHVDCHHRLYQRKASSQIGNRANAGRDRETLRNRPLDFRGVLDPDAGEPPMRACQQESDLDGIAWREVETMKPGSSTSGEDSTAWQTPRGAAGRRSRKMRRTHRRGCASS